MSNGMGSNNSKSSSTSSGSSSSRRSSAGKQESGYESVGSSNTLNNVSQYLQRHGYRMGRILGEGSYSKVKQCTRYNSDGTPSCRMACKMISKAKASDDFVTKFLPRELEIIGHIEHPNIIRVYDVVDFDHHVFIFMDCCEKGDLLEYVKSRGQISENRSRHYFRQLLSAVRYLHSKDIAHRDLKCENVLLGPGDLIKISDFGFSRFCRDNDGRRILSRTYCGSAAYAAPEILQGTSYNPKLYDMWSLGCILFIMLTGHMPYDESNIPKMLQHQVERIITYPANVEEALSHASRSLVRRLLEPDVTRRANIDHAICHEWTNFPTHPPLSHDCYEAGDVDPKRAQNENQVSPAVPMSYYGLPSRSEIFSQLIGGGPTTQKPKYTAVQPGLSSNPSKPLAVRYQNAPNFQSQRLNTATPTPTLRSAQETKAPKPRIPATARPPGGTTRGETSGSQRNPSRNGLVTGVATLVQSLSFGGSKGSNTTSSSAKPTGKVQRK